MSYKHGHRSGGNESPTHVSWRSLCERDNAKRRSYRGSQYYRDNLDVKVCDRWLGPNGFINFLSDMGERPANTSISRQDPWGDYTPENCLWESASGQSQKSRNRAPIEMMGQTTTMSALVKRGVPADTIHFIQRSRYKSRQQRVNG